MATRRPKRRSSSRSKRKNRKNRKRQRSTCRLRNESERPKKRRLLSESWTRTRRPHWTVPISRRWARTRSSMWFRIDFGAISMWFQFDFDSLCVLLDVHIQVHAVFMFVFSCSYRWPAHNPREFAIRTSWCFVAERTTLSGALREWPPFVIENFNYLSY